MGFRSTKTFGHDLGLSCCFRQWRARHSHCSRLHGYSLAIKLVFEADTLDDKGWVVDFGGMKDFKEKLQETFDHTLCIAADDPELELLEKLNKYGIAKVLVFKDGVGCEKFAQHVWFMANDWLRIHQLDKRVRVVSAEVMEHGANSAIYSQ